MVVLIQRAKVLSQNMIIKILSFILKRTLTAMIPRESQIALCLQFRNKIKQKRYNMVFEESLKIRLFKIRFIAHME